MFSSLLVANRGEIAARVFRTARRLGIRTIAVYSDADQESSYVREADESRHIGPSEARLSYLNGARIIDAALAAKAQAIHPGYGFLSENAEFAQACLERGIVFVGPSAEAIRRMGLKDEAKAIAERAGVHVVPGYRGADQSLKRLTREAQAIGYPVIIKAVAGGGGRGMRIVEKPDDFSAAFDACRREAQAAFGDSRVLLERFFRSARHVEVQLMADSHGNTLHFLERDCSIQRRHQKIVEEAPAHQISDDLRGKMHEAAVSIAASVDYRNAGTVEFLYDDRTGGYYFMEMNTRLQVEHPVTEMITGVDLVELQLLAAAGEKLPLSQSEIKPRGHAIEARLYAEDPLQGFLPQTGRVHDVIWPQIADIRIETGIAKGSEISSFYDPMIAKIVAWGADRPQAIGNLEAALQETFVFGVKTNKAFLLAILSEPSFAATAPRTNFLDQFGNWLDTTSSAVAIGCAAWLYAQSGASPVPWGLLSGWTLMGGVRRERRKVVLQGRTIDLSASYEGRVLSLIIDGDSHRIELISHDSSGCLDLLTGGRTSTACFQRGGSQIFIDVDGHHFTFSQPDYLDSGSGKPAEGSIRAPMPGRVLKLEVRNGTEVHTGDRLFVLEAMKMEHSLRAPMAGRVRDISVAEGQQVREGDFLCAIGGS